MSRQPRFVLVGHPQHVIIRGNNREPIFKQNNDYQFYLDKLKAACDKHHCDIHAYVLMTNHVHLLITPYIKNGISKAMQMVGRYYVQYFNKANQRTGTLWEGRYKATLIDSERYALICYRYIEMNPVRANMVEHPAEYLWSSYQTNSLGKVNSLVVPHILYRALGKNCKERQKNYRKLFATGLGEETLDTIRAATNKAWVLGDAYFKDAIAEQLDRPVEAQSRGGDRKSKMYQANAEINRV
jgi:putative transposase